MLRATFIKNFVLWKYYRLYIITSCNQQHISYGQLTKLTILTDDNNTIQTDVKRLVQISTSLQYISVQFVFAMITTMSILTTYTDSSPIVQLQLYHQEWNVPKYNEEWNSKLAQQQNAEHQTKGILMGEILNYWLASICCV